MDLWKGGRKAFPQEWGFIIKVFTGLEKRMSLVYA